MTLRVDGRRAEALLQKTSSSDPADRPGLHEVARVRLAGNWLLDSSSHPGGPGPRPRPGSHPELASRLDTCTLTVFSLM